MGVLKHDDLPAAAAPIVGHTGQDAGVFHATAAFERQDPWYRDK